MIVTRADGSEIEVPPDRCLAKVDGRDCGDTDLGPAWGQCPDCGAMCRIWRCGQLHDTPDIDHKHRHPPAGPS